MRNSSTWCAAICATRRSLGREPMLNLAEYRKKPQRLADFLPWAALIAPGIVLNKDGSFQRAARFRGPDLDGATPAELVGTTARLNNALRRLGSGLRRGQPGSGSKLSTQPISGCGLRACGL
jgi:type IV secretory pathway VirB4 component